MRPNPGQVRLIREQREIKSKPVDGVTVTWEKGESSEWRVEIEGPVGSFYEGDTFDLRLTMDSTWPGSPPRIEMLTPIFHPNMLDGGVCVEVVSKNYTSRVTLRSIIIGIVESLEKPNPDDRLDNVAGALLAEDKEAFAVRVREQIDANILSRSFAS